MTKPNFEIIREVHPAGSGLPERIVTAQSPSQLAAALDTLRVSKGNDIVEPSKGAGIGALRVSEYKGIGSARDISEPHKGAGIGALRTTEQPLLKVRQTVAAKAIRAALRGEQDWTEQQGQGTSDRGRS